MKDLKEQLLATVKTGQIICGLKETIHNLYTNEPALVITAKNCPETMKDRIKYYCKLNQTPFIDSPFTSQDIGSICGRQHAVSVITIVNPGESQIMEGRQ